MTNNNLDKIIWKPECPLCKKNYWVLNAEYLVPGFWLCRKCNYHFKNKKSVGNQETLS